MYSLSTYLFNRFILIHFNQMLFFSYLFVNIKCIYFNSFFIILIKTY